MALAQEFDGGLGLPWRHAARLDEGAAGALSSSDRAATFPFAAAWHPFFPRPPETRLGFRAAALFARHALLAHRGAAHRRRGQ